MIRKLIDDETGLETVEYAILAGMLVGVIGMIVVFARWLWRQYNQTHTELAGG